MSSAVIWLLATVFFFGFANAAFCHWKGHNIIGGFVGGCLFAAIAIPVSIFRARHPDKPSYPLSAFLGIMALFGAFIAGGVSVNYQSQSVADASHIETIANKQPASRLFTGEIPITDDCKWIGNTATRQGCYRREAGMDAPASGEAIQKSKTVTAPEYTVYDLTDFKIDKSGLIGKKVEVTGLLMPMNEMATLSKTLGDTSSIFIEVTKLPRNERRQLLECEMLCTGVVRGTVGLVYGRAGIMASSITFKR